MLVSIIIMYVIGYVTSLWLMHNFKEQLDIDCYDPPHVEYYDDYDNNAEAYATISLMWPIFWFVMFLKGCLNLLIRLSKHFEPKSKEEIDIIKKIKILEKAIADCPDMDPRDFYEIRHWKSEIEELKQKLETLKKS